MEFLGTTRLSSKGQVVIPKPIRDNLRLEEGDLFAIDGEGDTIVLRKIRRPSKEEFDKVLEYGRRFAEEHGITREDVEKAIQEDRRERGGGKEGRP